jgi:hypothetical protein
VDGLGKKYEALLQQQGITTVEQLAERLLDKLASQQAPGAFSFLKVCSWWLMIRIATQTLGRSELACDCAVAVPPHAAASSV